jgi:ferritin-like metal-binding protein YciE
MQGHRAIAPAPHSEDTMEITTLRDLFKEHIQDLYSAEEQIIDALPTMIKSATDPELRSGLQNHLQETRRQLQRLEEIGRMSGFDPSGHKCDGMKGILKEGNKLVGKEVDEDDVRDAAIISACQRVEHYEIAVYGTARTYARMLGDSQAVSFLEETLQEEKNADHTLTEVAESHVNRRAMAGD